DRGDERIADAAALLLVNPDPAREHGIDAGPLIAAAGGRFGRFQDVTPGVSGEEVLPGRRLTLRPMEMRILTARSAAAEQAAAAPKAKGRAAKGQARKRTDERESERRLHALAASRVAIEKVSPELDGGRFPVKRIVGDVLTVEADIFSDGHDKIAAALFYREAGAAEWHETPMTHFDNDRWRGHLPLTRNGRYEYQIGAWRDLFATWRDEVTKKHAAGQSLTLELIEGRHLLEAAATQATAKPDAFASALADLDDAGKDDGRVLSVLMSEELRSLMARHGPRTNLTRHTVVYEVFADRMAARFSAWYEMFPRSQSGDPERHGTFDDVIRKLPYVRDMGFDVLYFTPIHPIGKKNRKGRNNSLTAQPGDPGSPYAIGSEDGG